VVSADPTRGEPVQTAATAESQAASQSQSRLRDIAAKLRANGQTAEADAIEEALKNLSGAQSGGTANEIQQLRREMADVRAAIAGITQHAGPFDPEGDLARMKMQYSSAAASGFGGAHPKILALKQSIAALENELEAEKKSKMDQDARLLELRKAGPGDDPNNPKDLGEYLRKQTAAKMEADARTRATAMKLEMEKMKLDAERSALGALKESKEAAKAYEKAARALEDVKKSAEEDKVKARKAEPVKDTDQAGDNLPWGVAVPGRDGLAYSPYTPERSVVDVTGFKKGSKVKCPYTGNFFQVP
jgi:hypothetical protein